MSEFYFEYDAVVSITSEIERILRDLEENTENFSEVAISFKRVISDSVSGEAIAIVNGLRSNIESMKEIMEKRVGAAKAGAIIIKETEEFARDGGLRG